MSKINNKLYTIGKIWNLLWNIGWERSVVIIMSIIIEMIRKGCKFGVRVKAAVQLNNNEVAIRLG